MLLMSNARGSRMLEMGRCWTLWWMLGMLMLHERREISTHEKKM